MALKRSPSLRIGLVAIRIKWSHTYEIHQSPDCDGNSIWGEWLTLQAPITFKITSNTSRKIIFRKGHGINIPAASCHVVTFNLFHSVTPGHVLKKIIIKAQDIVHGAFRKITSPSDKMHLQLFEYLSADPHL